ncbi:MAG: CDP-alcohol phosphatidyltransferase family protein [Patescibacteria group bacterium]|nr:CDP-alcohol phosphatidyltransferase family protein [Patescibacteria group bacterium]
MENDHKIKKIIIKRKDDFLTALEKNWRDFLLKPLTNLFFKANISANQITYFGFILILLAIFMYLADYRLSWQLFILTLAAISDAIDGPTARNNDDITIKGTWLDHIRDGFLVAWASFLIYKFNLLSEEILLIIWSLQIILVWVNLKDFFIRYLHALDNESNKILEDFSLDNFQASVIGRLQFFFWTVSYGSLLLSTLVNIPILITIGQALIVIEIILSSLNILESYQKIST